MPLVKAVDKKRFKEHLGDLPEEAFRDILRGVGHAIHLEESRA